MRDTTNAPPRPDPADDRPHPGDPGTPQRPPPREATTGAVPTDMTDRAARSEGETARLADVPPARRDAGRDARLDDETKRGDVAGDAASRGIAAAIAGVDITPSEDR